MDNLVLGTRVPFKPLNTFYCVLLSLALLFTQIGLLGIISSSLLIYKINQDSKLLVDGSDICSLKGKGKLSANRTVECGNSCGLLTCPGFSLEKEGAALCDVAKECTRGRYSAAGLGLIFSLLQTGLTIYYISEVFIYRESMVEMGFKERWVCFLIFDGIYLFFTLIPMIIALVFNQAHVPKNPNFKQNTNSKLKGESFSCDGNFAGIFFVSWCGINAGLCVATILIVLYFQLIRRNRQDGLALYGVDKMLAGVDVDFDLAHPFDHNLVMVSIQDGDEAQDRTKPKFSGNSASKTPKNSSSSSGGGFSNTSLSNKKTPSDERAFSKSSGILGNNKPANKRRHRTSGSIEKGRRKRKIGRRSVGGTFETLKLSKEV